MISQVFEIQVFEGYKAAGQPKFKIKLPAVPRVDDTITLPDAHYLVKDVFWHANVPPDAGAGYEWPDSVYYTIRLVVEKKFPDD